MARALGDRRRDDDGLPRHHDRQRRPAPDRDRPGCWVGHRVGGHRLPARGVRLATGERVARRPVRPQARVPDVARGVHGGVGGVRARAFVGSAHRGACGAGSRRRCVDPGRHGDGARALPSRAPRPGDRDLGTRRDAGPGGRPDARWMARHGRVVALAVPHQRADRSGDLRVRAPAAPRAGRAAPPPVRRPRSRTRLRRTVDRRARPLASERVGVGLRSHDRMPGRRPRVAGRLRLARAARRPSADRAADARRAHVPHRHGRDDVRVRRASSPAWCSSPCSSSHCGT